jgi:signal peptidase II
MRVREAHVHREPNSRRSPRSILVMLGSLVLLTAIDVGTKEWALRSLSTPRLPENRGAACEPGSHGRIAYQRQPHAARPLIDGVLNLYYAENCGAAFSMLGTAPRWLRVVVFGTASIGAAVMLISMFVRGAGGPLFAAAVPLIVSGAVGNNLSDRPRHGFVVDFLQVHPDLFNYPIFNVADIWIVIGAGLLLIDGFRKPRRVTADPTAEPVQSA